ncbi:unnamed protein product [Moneuplotes crassus]|uniref:C2H2-type domain-containing protein n=1 Tax=Euplotes crassus TaxID=5936 RepID=A0AAD1U010_EUPCR|nr:unnamed protein product [Moneuplotes crassus]
MDQTNSVQGKTLDYSLPNLSQLATYWKDRYCFCRYQPSHLLPEAAPSRIPLDSFCKCTITGFYKVSNGQQPEKLIKNLEEKVNNIPPQNHIASSFSSSDKELEILKECEYSLRYDPVGTTTRTKRVVICEFEGCKKEFIKAWNFLDHFRMHQGVKPFICSICSNTFTQKGNLKKHMRQHINRNVRDRKIHKCRVCPKSYTERYNLRSHYAAKHPGQCMPEPALKTDTRQ